MSKYHSTVSRREFMKALGLAGAGLGVAAATAPVFHDLDGLAVANKTHTQHDWWVKERDYEDLTTPVDWTVFSNYDSKAHPMPPFNTTELLASRKARYARDIENNDCPSARLKDYALSFGARGASPSVPWNGPELTRSQVGGLFPTQFDITPWQGTPEDNMHTLRAAMHYYGAPIVGAIEINEHMERLFNKGTTVFENIDEGYRDESRVYHIPSKCRYIVCWLTKQNYMQNAYGRANLDEAEFISNRPLGGASSADAYAHAPQILYKTMRFLWALGYQAYKTSISGNTAVGVFGGLSEQGRAGYSMSPKYGLMLRYIDWCLTDLPLTTTKPIDFGGIEFCKTCMLCAEHCPADSVSMEKEPSYEVRDPGNNPGHKCWHQGWTLCASGQGGPWDCFQCQSVCPFNHLPDSLIHAVVRGTIGTTSIFNSFFTNMEKTFGYGKRPNDEDWWNRDLRTWPHDTLYGFGTAGW